MKNRNTTVHTEKRHIETIITNISITDPLLGTLTGPAGDTDTDGELDVDEIWTYSGSYTVSQAVINGNGVDINGAVDGDGDIDIFDYNLLLQYFGTSNSDADFNGNGSVDIVDALLVAQYYVGLGPSPFDTSVADVNCSGTIDIVDALLISQYYVGLISSLDC